MIKKFFAREKFGRLFPSFVRRGFRGGRVFLLLFFFSMSVRAQTVVPHLINFQSVLTDDGGNSIADGSHTINFQILDAGEQPLYEEKQTVESIAGVVSAIVGNGNTLTDGAATGGIYLEEITPDKARFLKVTVDNLPPQTLQITSVPFSMYSEEALTVAPGAITSSALAPKSVKLEHLADGVLEEIYSKMQLNNLPEGVATTDTVKVLQTTYQGSSGASQIGVESGFVYSKGQTLQQVVKDLDGAVQQRQVNIDQEKTALKTGLSGKLDNRGGTMTGILNMGTADNATRLQIKHVSDPTDKYDATTKDYVDTTVNTQVAESGDTMTGILNMGTADDAKRFQIKHVSNPTDKYDATTRDYVDTADTSLQTLITTHSGAVSAHGSDGVVVGLTTLNTGLSGKLDNSGGTMTGILNMGSHRIEGVSDPDSADDVATKNYVDTVVAPALVVPPPKPTTVAWGRIKPVPPNGCKVLSGFNISSCTITMLIPDIRVDVVLASPLSASNRATLVSNNDAGLCSVMSEDDTHVVVGTGGNSFSVAIIMNQ